MQGCLYGGQNEEGHLGDAWLFDAQAMTWQQTATSDFGGFSDAAKAWHAAAVLKCTDVSASTCMSCSVAGLFPQAWSKRVAGVNLHAICRLIFMTCARLTDVGAWVRDRVLLDLACKEEAWSI